MIPLLPDIQEVPISSCYVIFGFVQQTVPMNPECNLQEK